MFLCFRIGVAESGGTSSCTDLRTTLRESDTNDGRKGTSLVTGPNAG